jgi:hypothetical protein
MGWLSRGTGNRALACLAVFCASGIASLLAGFSSAPPARITELSPAEVVALRFHAAIPVQSNDFASSPAPAQYVLASAEATEPPGSGVIFSPHPAYAPPPAPRLEAIRASLAVVPALPERVLAYAGPDADVALPPVKRAAPAPVPHPASLSNSVLNSAQIASIRERLKLTSYQEQLWPPVESALRDISWRRDDRKGASKSDARSRTIDPDSAQVQRLKSAAMPLIMSLNGDQKDEIRTLARLMGLETLASQF